MSNHTCVLDGAPAKRRAKIGGGWWCDSCASWFRKYGTDPATRKRQAPKTPGAVCSIDECDQPYNAGGYCRMHYNANRRMGDPRSRTYRHKGELESRIAGIIANDTDDCIIYMNKPVRSNTKFNGVTMFVARAVWITANGHPGGMHVLHACNGGSGDHGCVNLRHLYLGDSAQNVLDKVNAGRSGKGHTHAQGELSGNAVLTAEQVREARSLWVRGSWFPHPGSTRALAQRYGVCESAIRTAMNGRGWKHLN